MAKSIARKTKTRRSKPGILRFAHPFFTTVPPEDRAPSIEGARRMTDHVKEHLETIPSVKGNSTMRLDDVVGAAGASAIAASGSIGFHAVGDTGHEDGPAQQLVADAMTSDFNISSPQQSPAFFLHLGDVDYYDNTDRGYHAQFYVPYKKYPGKIIAIPGNHDGELFKFDGRPTGQSKTLEAFQKNFCLTGDAVNVTSGTVLRQMVSQPGVYWRLDSPFVDIVGLYSNIAENPGYIQGGKAGTAQRKWLDKTLAAIAGQRGGAGNGGAGKRKALLIAVHHPPISNGSHSSSSEMLADIDDSCNKSGIMADAVVAAHSHDYQRYTRFVPFKGSTWQVPYLVIGSGGRGLSPHVGAATRQMQGDHRYEKSLRGYGYALVTVSPQKLDVRFFQVDEHTGKKTPFDKVSVDLASHTVT